MVYAVVLVLGGIVSSYMYLIAREKRAERTRDTSARGTALLGVVRPKVDPINKKTNKQKGREIDDEYRQ